MSDKIYCYPDSDVLINKLNIHDPHKSTIPSLFVDLRCIQSNHTAGMNILLIDHSTLFGIPLSHLFPCGTHHLY